MENVDEALDRWLEAGLIEPSTAERIRDFESARGTTAEPVASAEENRPSVIEALLYLGLVVLGVGVFALLAQQWEELESWARILSSSVPCALLLVAGLAMRFSDDSAMRRGGSSAWFVSVALFATALAVAITELGPEDLSGDEERNVFLLISAATVMFSLILWVASATHAQVVALAVSIFWLAEAIGTWPDEFSPLLAGIALLAAGLAGLALTEAGWMVPKSSARFCFALLAVAGPYQAGFESDDGETVFELLSFGVAAAVIALGVLRGSFALVLVGVGATFVALVTFIFEHFSDDLGAPLALILCGGLLVGAVMILALLRSESRARKAAAV